MRSIQSLAAQARRENDTNGLPAGGFTYSDPLKAKDNESGAIVEQYGTIANWRAWDDVIVKERATGRRVFDNEIARITGKSLHVTPAEALAALNQSTYEVK
jgi:hypothetical protein